MMPSDPRSTVSRPTAGQREFDIDFFRGFVCVCLIYLHFYTLGLIEYWDRIFGPNLQSVVWNFRLGVESFFVLAGLMMAHMLRPAPGEDVSLGLYLKRRFYRLIIPYWVAVLLATADRWAIYLIFKRGASDLPTVGDTISQLLLLQEVFHRYFPQYSRIGEAAVGYWSMVSLEQFYLIWLAVYAVVRWLVPAGTIVGIYGRREWVMALLTLFGGIASAAIVIGNWPVHWHLARFGIYLTLGMLLYWAVRQRYQTWMFVVGTFALIGMAIFGEQLNEQTRAIKGLLAVVIMTILARGYRTPNWMVFRALTYIGARSYSFYLMHAIVGYRVFTFVALPAIGGRGDWVAFPLLIVALGLTFVVSLLFYKYVESPCREMARRVNFRSVKPQPTTAPSSAGLAPSPPSPHPAG